MLPLCTSASSCLLGLLDRTGCSYSTLASVYLGTLLQSGLSVLDHG
jgi:hypothetical protein